MAASTVASSRTPPAQPIKLYRAAVSGHAHRVELFLSFPGFVLTAKTPIGLAE